MGEWESAGEDGDVSLCSQSPVAILLSVVRNSDRLDLCLWEEEILVVRSEVVLFGVGTSDRLGQNQVAVFSGSVNVGLLKSTEKNDDLRSPVRLTLAAFSTGGRG